MKTCEVLHLWIELLLKEGGKIAFDDAAEEYGGRTPGEARRQKYGASSALPLRYANSPSVS